MNTFYRGGTSSAGMSATNTTVTFGAPHRLTGVTPDCISRVRFSPPGCPMNLVGVTSWDSSCSVWEINSAPNGVIQSRPAWTTTHDGPLLDMSFTTDGRAFFAGCTNTAVIWDLRSNQKSTVASHDLPISCLAFVTLPQTMTDILVTGSWDGKIRCWDLKQPRPVLEINLGEPIFALDAQKSLPMMSVATGRSIHIFEMNGMQKVNELKPSDAVKFNFRCVACSPQLDGVATGSAEGRVSFINLNTATPGCTFRAHVVEVSSNPTLMYQTNFCVHHPAKPIIISGGGNGSISCCSRDANCKKLLKTLNCEATEKFEGEPIPISSGDLSADGSLLAYAHSYDWALGKKGYKKQPSSVLIRELRV